MKFYITFFELPWLAAALLSLILAVFNNSFKAHLESFAPFLLCLITLYFSFICFRENPQIQKSLFLYLRFFFFGCLGVLLIYWTWAAMGANYLKEGGLGLIAIYLVFIPFNLLALLGITIYTGIHFGVSLPSSEIQLLGKFIVGVVVFLGIIYGINYYFGHRKMGPGAGPSVVQDHMRSLQHDSNLKFSPGLTDNSVAIEVGVEIWGLWKVSQEELKKIQRDEERKAFIAKIFDQIVQDIELSSRLGFPFQGWNGKMDAKTDQLRLIFSADVTLTDLSHLNWESGVKELREISDERGPIPLSWIIHGLLVKYDHPEDSAAFQKACRKIAESILQDEESSLQKKILKAFDSNDDKFFREPEVQSLQKEFKPGSLIQVKIRSLRLLGLALAMKQ
jgi:hypothetical protein